MKVRLKLLPGQKGAKKLTTKYGGKLVCVRYLYDEKQEKRFTEVNIGGSAPVWRTLCNGLFDASVAVQPEAGRRRLVGAIAGNFTKLRTLGAICFPEA